MLIDKIMRQSDLRTDPIYRVHQCIEGTLLEQSLMASYPDKSVDAINRVRTKRDIHIIFWKSITSPSNYPLFVSLSMIATRGFIPAIA
jgi:hypothetical protein